MITVRAPETIYRAEGQIDNGTFSGRWHFSFDDYRDPEYMQFGRLRVFNDDTLSPGAVWPLHPHRDIEVVTYCAAGEFRHADEHGKGGILKKGDVQHTTVGSGLWHSEINNRTDAPMRFIQMWFLPAEHNLKPSVEKRDIETADRTDKLLLLVSNKNPAALKIYSDVEIFSCLLRPSKTIKYTLAPAHGLYLYNLEGGPVILNNAAVPPLAAAKVTSEPALRLSAVNDAELLLIDTAL